MLQAGRGRESVFGRERDGRRHGARPRLLIDRRLAAVHPQNDGKQTPMRGHPVFIAQHATATCCRGCLVKLHGIPAGQPLAHREKSHVAQAIRRWLDAQMESDASAAVRSRNIHCRALFALSQLTRVIDMGIFSEIWDRIMISAEERREYAERREQREYPYTPSSASRPKRNAHQRWSDVEAVLEQKASAKGGGAYWRTPYRRFAEAAFISISAWTR